MSIITDIKIDGFSSLYELIIRSELSQGEQF